MIENKILDKILDETLRKYTNLTLDDIKQRYAESHRHYHTWEHITDIFEWYEDICIVPDVTEILAILFHDISYDPTSNDNEFWSVSYFKNHCILNIEDTLKETVINLILKTKEYNEEYELSKADNSILYSSINKLIDYENKIFKEYQVYSLSKYITGRVDFLTEVNKKINNPAINELISYIKCRTYNIGVYAGSFDPFHVGHLDILKQAEGIFDKVIIAVGNNPKKENTGDNFIKRRDQSQDLRFREFMRYRCMLSYLIEQLLNEYKDYNVKFTLVRGLRNSNDFEEEKVMNAWLKKLNSELDICYLLSKPELQHISSTAIRELGKFDSTKTQGYIV